MKTNRLYIFFAVTGFCYLVMPVFAMTPEPVQKRSIFDYVEAFMNFTAPAEEKYAGEKVRELTPEEQQAASQRTWRQRLRAWVTRHKETPETEAAEIAAERAVEEKEAIDAVVTRAQQAVERMKQEIAAAKRESILQRYTPESKAAAVTKLSEASSIMDDADEESKKRPTAGDIVEYEEAFENYLELIEKIIKAAMGMLILVPKDEKAEEKKTAGAVDIETITGTTVGDVHATLPPTFFYSPEPIRNLAAYFLSRASVNKEAPIQSESSPSPAPSLSLSDVYHYYFNPHYTESFFDYLPGSLSILAAHVMAQKAAKNEAPKKEEKKEEEKPGVSKEKSSLDDLVARLRILREKMMQLRGALVG